jgi:hypothetical protein
MTFENYFTEKFQGSLASSLKTTKNTTPEKGEREKLRRYPSHKK